MSGSAQELAPGLVHHPGFLDGAAQGALAAEIALVLAVAPALTPVMPRTGRPFSVRMSNAGPLGWVSDRAGYRYQDRHPETGQPWPPIPARLLDAWARLTGWPVPPEACLINLYGPSACMGQHQDRDEDDLSAPVLSLSMGSAALFRYGGPARRDPTRSVRLASGDALVIGGASRLIHHGIDRLLPSEPDLLGGEGPGDGLFALRTALPEGGRCNLTLRRVTPAIGPPRA